MSPGLPLCFYSSAIFLFGYSDRYFGTSLLRFSRVFNMINIINVDCCLLPLRVKVMYQTFLAQLKDAQMITKTKRNKTNKQVNQGNEKYSQYFKSVKTQKCTVFYRRDHVCTDVPSKTKEVIIRLFVSKRFFP